MLEIRPVRYPDLLAATDLLSEYAAECSIPEIGEANPQPALYAQMEASGMMHQFGAYLDGKLIGFASVLMYPLPHYGKKIATMESIFVAGAHRKTGAGSELINAVEADAIANGCTAFSCIAPVGSTFEKLLMIHKRFRRTNSVFWTRL